MGDVLTQAQIDALLNSVQSSGNFDDSAKADEDDAAIHETDPASNQKYKKYNFHTPKKFTKDRMKLLRGVYENYARMISSQLTSLLRIACEIELSEIEEQRYYEFNNALGDDSLLAFINVEMDGSGVVEDDPALLVMSNSAMYTMLDRMLGGTGDYIEENDEGEQQNTVYTDVEIAIYETVLRNIAPIMDDVWKNYLNLKFKYHKIEPNPSLVQVMSIDEIIVIITFNIIVKDTQGQISICLPGSILDKLFRQFEAAAASGARRKDSQTSDEKENIVKGIESSILEVKAEFENSSILLEELYSMRVGDILNLSMPKTSEINVIIGNKPWFKGRLGVYKENVAVRLSGIYKEQQIINAGGEDDE